MNNSKHGLAGSWALQFEKLDLIDDYEDGHSLAYGPAVSFEKVRKTRVKLLDDDHKILVKLINKLAIDVKNRKPSSVVNLTIDLFNQYAIEHFQREESLMLNYHYPNYHAHRKSHIAFRRLFHAVRVVINKNASQINYQKLIDYLCDWIVIHVGIEDIEFAFHIASAEEDRGYFEAIENTELTGIKIGHLTEVAKSILESNTKESIQLRAIINDLWLKMELDIDYQKALGISKKFTQ